MMSLPAVLHRRRCNQSDLERQFAWNATPVCELIIVHLFSSQHIINRPFFLSGWRATASITVLLAVFWKAANLIWITTQWLPSHSPPVLWCVLWWAALAGEEACLPSWSLQPWHRCCSWVCSTVRTLTVYNRDSVVVYRPLNV